MKLPVLAVLGAALLLSACAKKEAEACASPDVKDQLMRIFLQGAITERSPEFKDSALRDVAILEKDPDSGVLSCVGTLSVPAGQQVVEGVLQYRIAPVAKSDYDYLLLDTAGANTTALAQRLNKELGQSSRASLRVRRCGRGRGSRDGRRGARNRRAPLAATDARTASRTSG